MANFSEVYAKYAKQVYRFLLSLSGSEQQAEELTQQTFYKAFLHIDRFEGRSSLYTWLCGIGKNEWLMDCRKKSCLPLEEISQRETEGVEAEILRREIQIAVRRALLALPEPYRDVLIMRTYGDVPFAQIAAAHGKSESWAKVIYFRGKDRLRKELEGYR